MMDSILKAVEVKSNGCLLSFPFGVSVDETPQEYLRGYNLSTGIILFNSGELCY